MITDPELIQRWADDRDVVTATIRGSRPRGRAWVLGFDFGADDSGLRHIAWQTWFATFDDRRLNVIYQKQTAHGNPSNFFRLENPEREDAGRGQRLPP